MGFEDLHSIEWGLCLYCGGVGRKALIQHNDAN
jgi:hypothetical protein